MAEDFGLSFQQLGIRGQKKWSTCFLGTLALAVLVNK